MEYKVQFVDEKAKKEFEKISKSEDKELKHHLERAFNDLLKNPFCGICIPKKLIPKQYIRKYRIKNIWKYNLPGAWRLLYSIESDKVSVISIILEWLDHKNYKRRFKY